MSTDIKSLSQILKDVLNKYELNDIVEKNLLIEKFKEVVGEQIAKQIEFKDFEKGILTIEVESSAWKNEIFLLREQIVERVNNALGKQIIKQIKIL